MKKVHFNTYHCHTIHFSFKNGFKNFYLNKLITVYIAQVVFTLINKLLQNNTLDRELKALLQFVMEIMIFICNIC